jgi:dGTP triphosphohydrolase
MPDHLNSELEKNLKLEATPEQIAVPEVLSQPEIKKNPTESSLAAEKALPSWSEQTNGGLAANLVNDDQIIINEKLIKEVEHILEEDLGDIYFSLTPQLQQKFKTEGEKTSQKISEILRGAVIKVKEIMRALREWLKIIPGVNRFFLEQEIKIKTEQILQLADKNKKIK